MFGRPQKTSAPPAPRPEAPPGTGGLPSETSFGFSENLGELLRRAGVVSAAQIQQALDIQKRSGQRLGTVLIDEGFTTEETIARTLADQLHIPFFELDEEFRLSREEVGLIPEAVARRFSLIPYKPTSEPVLTVVMADPIDIEAVSAVRALTNLEVHKAVSTPDRIRQIIDKFYREEAHIESNIQDIVNLEETDPTLAPAAGGSEAEQLRVMANDAPVVRYVNLVLMEAVRDRASDIHFEPGEHSTSVRLRIDGLLRETTPPPHRLYQAIVTRLKILSNMDIAERRLPQDGRFKFQTQGRVIDVRVSSLPLAFGEKVVLRILDRSSIQLSLETVGFKGPMLDRFKHILRRPHGIVLLTGPTGSGKTTTLYSALNFLKSPTKNIQTVEDPVEYLLPGINQMPTRSGIGLTFASALRSILRQDPDIIMIGEIRDEDTARIAMRASLTGHLVFSTLHTNDAVSAFSRLRDIGIEPYLISATINLSIAQRLVRTVCAQCARPHEPSPAERELIESLRTTDEPARFRMGAGCEACGNTGYRGRTAIMEFLEVTDPIRTAILQREGDLVIKALAVEQGMTPLAAEGMNKIHRGLTTLEEVLSVLPEADTLSKEA